MSTHPLLIVLLVCLLKSLKSNEGKIMKSQRSTKETEAQPSKKTAESAESISAIKRLSYIKRYKMTFGHILCHFHLLLVARSRSGCQHIARVTLTSSEELGAMPKNDLYIFLGRDYLGYVGDSLSYHDIFLALLVAVKWSKWAEVLLLGVKNPQNFCR